MEHDCNVCRAIWLALADTKQVGKINLDSVAEALTQPCPIYTSFIQSIEDQFLQGESCNQYLSITPRSKDRSAELSGDTIYSYYLLLVNRFSVPDHPGTGRILDPDWVDIDLARRWKHECLTAHGTKCENPLKVWPTRPAWLIDVKLKCIVSGQDDQESKEPFIALSYRYGDHPSFTIDAETWTKLQEPGALDTSTYLSPMIEHAMYLTTVLGERYLWADTFCIPHHDREVATQQLQLMGAIYGNAIVTIIAADTDSKEGIPGLRGISNPRKLKQEVIPFGDEKVVVRNTYGLDSSAGQPYYDRGWTYQEYALSSRKLLFNEKELHWRCSCSVWHEEMILGAEADKFDGTYMHTIQSGFPYLWHISNIIYFYNIREFRYDEDAFPAISGLLSVASRSFAGGFLYGLPEMFFDCALGWHAPRFGYKLLCRRTTSQRPIDSRLHPSCLPSWSWIGWKGNCDFFCDEMAEIRKDMAELFEYSIRIRETFPITTWYTADSPTATALERRRIRSTWFANRESYKDPNTPLPPGWTRHEESTKVDKLWPYPDGCGNFVFKHEAKPGLEWFYPFPVADITESTPSSMPEQTAYLFCETQRAYLWARIQSSELSMELLDEYNMRVGILDYHNDSQLEGFPNAVGNSEVDESERHRQAPPGKQVELVAISEYKVYGTTRSDYVKMKSEDDTSGIEDDATGSENDATESEEDEAEMESEDDASGIEYDATGSEEDVPEMENAETENEDGDFWDVPPVPTREYITVLWIEWVDGVAYRLASGNVDKEAWNRLPLENISLILG